MYGSGKRASGELQVLCEMQGKGKTEVNRQNEIKYSSQEDTLRIFVFVCLGEVVSVSVNDR